jgi:hypothetical protein
MKKLLIPLLPLLFLLLPLTASASTQILMGNTATADAFADGYMENSNNGVFTPYSTSTAMIAPIAGTLSHLYGYLKPGGTQTGSWSFTLTKNGVDTALTCNSATNCSDLTHSISINPGDSFAIHVHRSGGTGWPSFSLAFTPTTANETMLVVGYSASGGNSPLLSGASKEYIGWKPSQISQQLDSNMPWADSGTVDHLYVAATSSLSTGQYVFAITSGANASDSLVTCTLGTSANNCNDTSHATTTVAGNYSSISSTPTSPDLHAAIFGARFVPTTAGNFEISGMGGYITTAGYGFIIGGGSLLTVEASTTVYAQPMVITALYVQTQGAFSGGATRTYTLNDNGVATALTCTISGVNSQCSITRQSVTVAQGDQLDYHITQTGSPAGYTNATLSAHVPTSVRVNYPKTSAKNFIQSGFVRILGGFFRIK